MNEDLITEEDIEDVLIFHRHGVDEGSEVERLASTINYALDKFLSKLMKKIREEDRAD